MEKSEEIPSLRAHKKKKGKSTFKGEASVVPLLSFFFLFLGCFLLSPRFRFPPAFFPSECKQLTKSSFNFNLVILLHIPLPGIVSFSISLPRLFSPLRAISLLHPFVFLHDFSLSFISLSLLHQNFGSTFLLLRLASPSTSPTLPKFLYQYSFSLSHCDLDPSCSSSTIRSLSLSNSHRILLSR